MVLGGQVPSHASLQKARLNCLKFSEVAEVHMTTTNLDNVNNSFIEESIVWVGDNLGR